MTQLNRQAILERIEATGVIAVIRADSSDQLIEVCQALREAGDISCEITMTTPGALDAIARATGALGDDCLIGVGSVLDADTGRLAIQAGAKFVFSPILDLATITMAHQHDRVAIPGALSPTEIHSAWSGGADLVKIFPANHFGPRYIKDLKAPLPQIKVTPTGGVDLTTTTEWIQAGASAVGVGSALVKKDLIRERRWKDLTNLAKQFVDLVSQAREGSG